MRHQFLGLNADEWSVARGDLPYSDMVAGQLDIADVKAGIVAMLRRLDDEGDGYEQIGWMDPFGEVHSDRTHADCEPEPPCIAVYRAVNGSDA